MRLLLAVLIAFVMLPAGAAEVAGVQLQETVHTASGSPLVLNGAGLRKRMIFKVYAMGLYFPRKTSVAADAIATSGPKRVAIHMLRDVDAATFSDALADGIRANHSEAELKAIDARVLELTAIMAEMKEAKSGMLIELDWVPDAGTVVRIDGTARGKPIAGEDFYRALLRIWLGDHPVQSDLKSALLGQES
jgi:hypothetical protein